MTDAITTIVIFGATGDLAQRKLVPALFNLWCKGRLPRGLRIVGYARSSLTDDQYRKLMWNGARELGQLETQAEEWEAFARDFFYVCGDLTVPGDFMRLRQRISEVSEGAEPSNVLIYLPVAPSLYEAAIKGIQASGLAGEDTGWRQVIIEKPFGRDLVSAKVLNKVVHQVVEERQVYRIDHYLGKETVQNLLVFRFANAIF